MVVETRLRKKRGASEGAALQTDTNQTSRPEEEPSLSSFSAGSTATQKSVLVIQAEHARKIAAMERTMLDRERVIMERERVLMERERAALDLEAQAQIALLEDSRSQGTRRSSKLSDRDIKNWLDNCLDKALPSNGIRVVAETSQYAVPSTSQKVPDSTVNQTQRPGMVPNSSDFMVNARSQLPLYGVNPVPTHAISARPQLPLPCTVSQKATSLGDIRRLATYQDPTDYLQDIVPTHHNNNKSDITLLAEAIASLTTKPQQQQIRCGDGRLPIFDGKPLDWLSFQRAFEDTKMYYSASDNLARINIAVKGVAREAIAVLLVSARDPHEVMSALQMRFGRPEFIVLQEIAVVRTLPRINYDNNDLHKFACRVRNCVEIIKLLNQRAYLESPELFQAILSKLTPILRARWMDFGASQILNSDKATKLELLSDFLSREVDLQLKFGLLNEIPTKFPLKEKVHTMHLYNSEGSPSSSNINTIISFPEQNKSENIEHCLFCNDKHLLQYCDSFKSMSINERWKFVKDKKICHKCLKQGSHSYKYCRSSKQVCLDKKCFRRHHRLLHSNDSIAVATIVEKSEEQTDASNSSEPSVDVVAHTRSLFTDAVADTSTRPPKEVPLLPLLKVVAVSVSGPLGTVETYALLDDGSSATFIENDIANQIGVKGPCGQIRLDCVGGLSKDVSINYVDFMIKGRNCSDSHSVTKARAINSLALSRQTVSDINIKKFPHLSDLDTELCYVNAQPKIIIGIDNWHLTLPETVRKGTKKQPVAIQTPLGWVLFGFGYSRTEPIHFVDKINHIQPNETGVNDPLDLSFIESLIKQQYNLDSIGISKVELRSKHDERAIQILEKTARRLPNGRFEVGLPWKSDKPIVPDSFPLAYSRFLSLERKMLKDSFYADRYKKNIHDLIKKDYAEKCTNDPIPGSVCWYLPHFGVINPNKPAKLRVVNDAAAKVDGISLNSLLLTGPDLLQSLYNILLRFRERKVALIADIKEMFPQFKIIERDRDAQRFLWRDSPSEPIGIYRMSSMIFGAASSPFTAIYLKNKNALEFNDQSPEATRVIIEDTYMDDYIGSVGSVQEASKLALGIVNIHAQAGLEMRGWISNKPDALSSLPKNLLSDSMIVELGSTISCMYTRALGLIWHPNSDTISFNTPVKNEQLGLPDRLTKRTVLSILMQVFDPLGILAPVTIRGRILFQNAWRLNLNWDQPLPESEIAAWNVWYKDLIVTSQLDIPRYYNCSLDHDTQVELHVFADASAQAYTAVAYWRFIHANGDMQLSLISSKCRVAPLKTPSIPRLELQAALIASRLAHHIVEACRLKPSKRFFWTDSMNVLGWLRNDARRFKPFVAHRIAEIVELTDVNEWNWVPGDLNVADDATRLKHGSLTLTSRWIKGPDFLLSSVWPKEPQHLDFNVIEDSRNVHVIEDVPIVSCMPLAADSHRFSSWMRLIRATAYAHRYLIILRIRSLHKKGYFVNPSTKVDGHLVTFGLQSNMTLATNRHTISPDLPRSTLAAHDLILSEIHVFRRSQLDSFAKEIDCVTKKQPFPSRSRLAKLPAYVDKDRLLRLSSRIKNVTGVEDDLKNPILLDGKHPAVRLLVLHYHCKAAHANTETVINEIRQCYWILHLRSTVRTVIYRCNICQIRRAIPTVPVMGNLPPARLAHHCRPFSFVGLDYFGPIIVSIGRRSEKRWVALFTCFSIRAIHLEIVASLSTDSAIMALRRFIARRGTPTEIHSDNGTAFVGANKILQQLYGEAVENYASNAKISWKFLPPSAPFMAGATERMVKSVKTALKVTLHLRSPKEEVLMTLLCEAEALVNSRPLTHVPCDPEYPEGLTPNHFILGSSSGQPFPVQLSESDMCSRAGWRKALRLSDHFWQRWMREYLPTLSPTRSKGTVPSIAIGDQVLIADGNLPRGSWPRGRVSALYPGDDGVVRVVDVRTLAGVLRRPVRKVITLPF